MACYVAQYNICFIAGDDYEQLFQYLDESQQAIDLTDLTLTSQIRDSATSAAVVESFTITKTDAPNGFFTLSLTKAQTQALVPTGGTIPASDTFVYDVEEVDLAGVAFTRLGGTVTVTQSVTRP